MTTHSLHLPHLSLKPVFSLVKFYKLLTIWYKRHHTRKQLLSLPDYLLKDVGLNRTDALIEAAKPFWKD